MILSLVTTMPFTGVILPGATHSILATHVVQKKPEGYFGRSYQLLQSLYAVVKILMLLLCGSLLPDVTRFVFI